MLLQVDRQAEDRSHRLGQTRPVWVHRMVLKGTVDNNIYQIAQRKLRLDKEVLEVRWHLISCGQLGRGFLAVCLMYGRVEVL